MNYKELLILFFITFIVVFIIYRSLFIRNNRRVKKNKKYSKEKKDPVEIKLLENYFKVDINRLRYSLLINGISLVSSLDIAVIVTIACIFKRGYMQLLVGFVLSIPIMYVSYYLFSKILIFKINKGEKRGDKNE